MAINKLNLKEEIALWKRAVWGKEVRPAQVSMYEKLEESVNGTIDEITQTAVNVEASATKANQAATRANTAAGAAESATTAANAAKNAANTAAGAANTAAAGANTAKDAANSATQNATTAKNAANTAAGEANKAAGTANTAAGAANTAAAGANTAKSAANASATKADQAAANAKTQADYAKQQGDAAKEAAEGAIPANGGDISNTVIRSIDTISTQFPVPAAGESTKTFLGKVRKFIQDFNSFKTGIITVGKLVNNGLTTQSGIAALDAAMGKTLADKDADLQAQLTKLNGDLGFNKTAEHFVGYNDYGVRIYSVLKIASIQASSTNSQAGWVTIGNVPNLIYIDLSKTIIQINDEPNVQYPVESGAAGAYFRWNVSDGNIQVYFATNLNKAVTVGYYPIYSK